MKEINIYNKTGNFAENKDVARQIRLDEIIPALNSHHEVILNFTNVESATQSFIHALISDLIRIYGSKVLDSLKFKSCNESIQKIISIVTEYMQEAG